MNVNTPDSVLSMAKPPMVMRSIRVPEALWEAAKGVADERQENVSDFIREALQGYVRRGTKQSVGKLAEPTQPGMPAKEEK